MEADWRYSILVHPKHQPPWPLKRPSQKALDLGEELLDYVSYGLTRKDAIHELAEMVDESNSELLKAVSALLQGAQHNGGVPAPFHTADLQRVFADYEPTPSPLDAQVELGGIGLPTQSRLL